jgi:hypothetical protein
MRRLFHLLRSLAVGLAAVLLMTGCSLLGNSAEPSPPGSWGLEKSTIPVGRLALVDAVPLHIAIDPGTSAHTGRVSNHEQQVTSAGDEKALAMNEKQTLKRAWGGAAP